MSTDYVYVQRHDREVAVPVPKEMRDADFDVFSKDCYPYMVVCFFDWHNHTPITIASNASYDGYRRWYTINHYPEDDEFVSCIVNELFVDAIYNHEMNSTTNGVVTLESVSGSTVPDAVIIE